MSDYGDGFDASDDEWAYLDAEDVYDEIDDLIEHACPSPAFESNDTETLEYDTYDYFNVDLEYLSDSYFDCCIQQNTRVDRKDATNISNIHRRKRRIGHPSSHAPVLWRSQIACQELPIVQSVPNCKSFALLKDWRDRFQNLTPVTLKASITTSHQTDADAIDVHDLHSIVKMLAGNSLEALTANLVDKGLDPEAIKVVLQDIVSNEAPVFDSGADDLEDDDDDDDSDTVPGEMGPHFGQEGETHSSGSSPSRKETDILAHRRMTRQQARRTTIMNENSKDTSPKRGEEASRTKSKRKRDNPPNELIVTGKRLRIQTQNTQKHFDEAKTEPVASRSKVT